MKRYVALALTSVAGILLLLVMPDKEAAANIILAGTAGIAWAFVLLYLTRSHWSATAAGRAIIRLVVCIAAICTQGLVTILSDYSYPGREVIRPLLLLGVGLAVLDLLVTLVRIQRDEKMEDRWHS